ncbi:helix-turn-helix domain-containing protein [Phaeobacter marinintestinus]|uniref:helix-turn-helix domain-containing protein n=1 Tax=Falsiphaeobacter marinintestinus TaxID=1492905 RepID=UPI0011B4C97F|nr:helix-turn-helix domain-containing protein [Phaeobacter marinintestinus]
MIGRRFSRKPKEEEVVEPLSFDDFELRLGDMMRGERATLGKSLLDVQRDLRIKASYIAAIENADPSAFDTPGFVAGYVRSYARYLNMEPDEAFAAFCVESGFTVAHGMSAEASGAKKNAREERAIIGHGLSNDPFSGSGTPFLPEREGLLSQIEPRAIGSTLVLLAVIGGIGYGGWSVLKEVQQVQVTPVEQAPVVLSDLDPVTGALANPTAEEGTTVSSTEALNRLYRPQALDVPVMVSRDAPISTLDPRAGGSFSAPDLPDVQIAEAPLPAGEVVPQVLEDVAPTLVMVAVRPSWVRVRAADGTTIYETIMEGGQTFEIPATEEPPTLRAGESGAIYFVANGENYGPVGGRGTVTKNLPLSIAEVTDRFEVANLEQDNDLARVVAELQTPVVAEDPTE